MEEYETWLRGAEQEELSMSEWVRLSCKTRVGWQALRGGEIAIAEPAAEPEPAKGPCCEVVFVGGKRVHGKGCPG